MERWNDMWQAQGDGGYKLWSDGPLTAARKSEPNAHVSPGGEPQKHDVHILYNSICMKYLEDTESILVVDRRLTGNDCYWVSGILWE